jgi:hypothetical protein
MASIVTSVILNMRGRLSAHVPSKGSAEQRTVGL